MPKPVRIPPQQSIDIRFCRTEIQKVIRANYEPSGRAPKAGALTCLGMFQTVLDLYDPVLRSQVMRRKKDRDAFNASVVGYLTTHPGMFISLLVALEKSDQRLKGLRHDQPDRIMEEHFPELMDDTTYRKYAEVVPDTSEAILSQVRKARSKVKKIIDFWERAFTDESRDGPYSFVLSSDGKTVDLYLYDVGTA